MTAPTPPATAGATRADDAARARERLDRCS